jgi:hypothetical protein
MNKRQNISDCDRPIIVADGEGIRSGFIVMEKWKVD